MLENFHFSSTLCGVSDVVKHLVGPTEGARIDQYHRLKADLE